MNASVLPGLVLGSLVLVAAAAPGPAPVGRPAPGREGCIRKGCHEDLKTPKTLHHPVEEGACDACHEEVDQKNHKFKLTADEPEVCTECHSSVTEDLRFEHGPVAAGSCTVCHDPHASNHDALLVAASPALCLNCHEELKDALEDRAAKHDPAVQDCLGCHLPHGGPHQMLLKARPPALCTDCHDTIADLMDEAPIKHAGMTRTKLCTDCHDPHAAEVEHLLKHDSMTLCLACHAQPVKAGKRTLVGFAELLARNPDRHGPLRDRDCVACHAAVHGGETFRLLGAAFPARFYSPYEEERYALCFGCHDAELVEEQETDEATGFRNGTRNLHSLHVNRKKGRTCRACHAVHASRMPFHLAASVPFGKGGWSLPIHFQKTAGGGSCQPGCHKRYRYDREKPVVNVPPPRRGPGAKPAPPGR